MKTITTLLLSFVATASMMANISKTEKEALLQLYKATNGSQWTNKWDLKASETTWYGVKIQNNQVIALNLSNNHLVGQLPAEIGSLVYLQQLNLFKNDISGVIPASIGSLKKMKNLNLAFNKLSGTIPTSIGDATALISVEMFMNQLSGELPAELGKLKNLKTLSFLMINSMLIEKV
jgi:Leucine-rich repeat (LRR) protein